MDDDGLFAINVDADDYAETAAAGAPSVSRTFQSEQDWQAQKASYHAKIDNGNLYAELMKTIPSLDPRSAGHEMIRLEKKEVRLLEYAVGEMYFEKRYQEILGLCERVKGRCVADERLRLGVSLESWMERSRRRLGRDGGEGGGD